MGGCRCAGHGVLPLTAGSAAVMMTRSGVDVELSMVHTAEEACAELRQFRCHTAHNWTITAARFALALRDMPSARRQSLLVIRYSS